MQPEKAPVRRSGSNPEQCWAGESPEAARHPLPHAARTMRLVMPHFSVRGMGSVPTGCLASWYETKLNGLAVPGNLGGSPVETEADEAFRGLISDPRSLWGRFVCGAATPADSRRSTRQETAEVTYFMARRPSRDESRRPWLMSTKRRCAYCK